LVPSAEKSSSRRKETLRFEAVASLESLCADGPYTAVMTSLQLEKQASWSTLGAAGRASAGHDAVGHSRAGRKWPTVLLDTSCKLRCFGALR